MRKMIFTWICLSTLLSLGAAAVLLALFFSYSDANFVEFANNFFYSLLLSGIEKALAALIFIAVLALLGFAFAFLISHKITVSFRQIDLKNPDDIIVYEELSPFVDNILAQQNDIENRLNELSEQAETSRSIFENLHEGFIMLDRFGAIISANQQARNFFEADEGCIGSNVNSLSHNTIFLDKIKAVLQGHSGKMIYENREQTCQISFINSMDRGAIVLIANISEQQLAEKTQREFAGNVSHQLSAPLSCIAGFAEILSKGQVKAEDIRHFATKIYDEAQGSIKLLESILFLAKLDEMDGREAFEDFDAAQVASEAIESLRTSAESAQLDLILAAGTSSGGSVGVPSPTCLMHGSRPLIYVLFVNLITNAIRYNRPKGWVKVAVSLRNQALYINVSDTGRGIPKEIQSQVFERFYSQRPLNSQEPAGTGLGLSIARHITRYHGGTIDIESVPDEGTRVFVKLPQD